MTNDVFEVRIEKENYNHYCADPRAVYECLVRSKIDIETAIDASSWCELACFDEIYEDRRDRFTIELIELEREFDLI